MMTYPQVMTMPDFEEIAWTEMIKRFDRFDEKLDEISKKQDYTNSKVQTLWSWYKSSDSSGFVWYKDKKVVTLLAIMGVLFMVAVVAAAGGDIPSWLAL